MEISLCVLGMCVCPLAVCLYASSLAFGNCNGLAVVDYLQKTILLCMSTLDLYGAADPYQRLTRSPRRNRQSTSGSQKRHLWNGATHIHAHIRTHTQLVQTHNNMAGDVAITQDYYLFSILLSFLLSLFCLLSPSSL